MRKVINGKTYNTSTAELVAKYFHNGLQGQFDMYNTEFYRKRNGEIFIVYNAKIFIDEAETLLKNHMNTSTVTDNPNSLNYPSMPFLRVYNESK